MGDSAMRIAILSFLLMVPCLYAQSNPLTYNAITNHNTYSSPAPTLGSTEGTTTVDPDFGTTVLRVTASGSCSQDAGYDYAGSNSGWQPMFNANDTEIMFQGDETGDRWFIRSFNPTSLALGACTRIYGGACGSNFNIQFSFVNPNIIWCEDPTDSNAIIQYNFSSASSTRIVDFSTVPGFTVSTLFGMQVDTSDAWVCVMNNSEDSGNIVGCYNASTGHTEVLNIANATYQADSGSPVALDNLTAAQTVGCGVHETYMRDGSWFHFGLNGCSAFPSGYSGTGCCQVFWQIGTNHVTWQPSSNSAGGAGFLFSGHEAMGDNGYIIYDTASNFGGGCGFSENPTEWNAASIGSNGSPQYAPTQACSFSMSFDDDHLSWLNNAFDSYKNQYPFFAWPNRDTTNTGVPYEWEIIAFATNPVAYSNLQNAIYGPQSTGGTIWRFAHTYNDPISSQCALMEDVSPGVSFDGKFAMFTSDWDGGTGTGTCTNSRRTDVFIAKLPLNGGSSGNSQLFGAQWIGAQVK